MFELLAYIPAILFLVTIHEWGHYWVAKKCGVGIEKFSIGFGRHLFTWKNKEGTLFCISMIPLGGYVKMRGEYTVATQEKQSNEAGDSFASRTVWQRIAIVVAGPLMNIIFAILVFAGMGYGNYNATAPFVDTPQAGALLAETNIQKGDQILAVNGEKVQSFESVIQLMIKSIFAATPIDLSWKSHLDGQQHQSIIPVHDINIEDKALLTKIGLMPARQNVFIRQLVPDMPAQQAGLQAGDEILTVNGQNRSRDELFTLIKQNTLLDIQVKRQDQVLTIQVMPKAEAHPKSNVKVGKIGAVLDDVMPVPLHRNALQAVGFGLTQTYDYIGMSIKGIYKLATGQLSVRSISGPVGTAKIVGDSLSRGWDQYLLVLGLLSVSVGALNLLPIPVLDGGHLLYYAIEVIRGKPLPEKVLQIGQSIGMMVLFAFLVAAAYSDVLTIFSN